ncbi:MAG: aspartate aminotransferase family protein [Bacillus sp. (in: firmicutes)]
MGHSSLIKPVLDGDYPMVSHGQGIYLYDADGKEYLDGCSGAVTANIGHGNQDVKEAMIRQAENVSFVYRSQFTSEPAERLAEMISNMTGGGQTYSFFVNSGSEATETALKIAIQYWQEKGKPRKTLILSRWISYHGITLGALSMSGFPGRRDRFSGLLNSKPSLPAPYCYRCPYGSNIQRCGLRCADELQTEINRVGKENIAAFICEPVIGAAGTAIPAPDGYLKKTKEICEQNEILFIADEVMTGIGRTGTMLGCDHDGVIPDIAALGKGLSGGYTPIAATMISEEIFSTIQKGSNSIMSGHTFSSNPLSAAVSSAVLSYIRSHNLMEQVEAKGDMLTAGMRELQETYSIIGDIRGKGLLLGLEFVKNRETKEPFGRDMNITGALVEIARKYGLLIYPAQAGSDGVNGDGCIIAPPLTVTYTEMRELLSRLSKSISELTQYVDKKGTG